MLIILSGCSGVGKNTVIKELLKRNENTLKFLKTCTTRQPRENEDKENGPYHYLTKEGFDKKIKNDEFFEHEEIHKNFYGTLKQSIEDIILNKYDYIKDVGVLGQINLARELSQKAKVLSIFLTAPKKVLIERLKNRGEADIDLRLSRMDFEMSYLHNYNFVIENLHLEKTVKKIEKLILKTKKQK